jgi:hypothetical protein
MADPVTLGFAAFSIALNIGIALLTPKPQPPRVDTRVPTATAGEDIYLIWGTVRLPEIRIWSIPLEQQTSGGKGLFAGTPNIQYFATYAVLLNRAITPVAGITRIWLNKKIKMDLRSGIDQSQQTGTIGSESRTSLEFAQSFVNFHNGGVNLPDAVIAERSGVDQPTPLYHYRTFLTINNLPVTDEFGNNSPAVDAEVSANGTPIDTGPSYFVATEEPFQWISEIAEINSDQLTKASASNQYDVSGVTSQSLLNNGGSSTFYINGSRALVGLSSSSIPLTTIDGVDYGIEVIGSDFHVIENGVTVFSDIGSYTPGSEISIVVNDLNYPVYLINGVQLYESTTNPSYPLYAHALIYSAGATVSGNIEPVTAISAGVSPIIRLNDVAVADIIRDLYSHSGIDPELLDLTEVDYRVPGCRHGSKPARELVQQLMQAFFLEVVELGGVIRFQKAQRPSVSVIIPREDLGAREGTDVGEIYVEDIADPLTLPTEVKVMFVNQSLDYDTDQADFRNASSPNPNNLETIEFDLILDRAWAENVARIWTFLPYIERYTYKFSLPPKYLYLLPGDVVGIPVDGQTVLVKLTKREVGANFLVSFEAKGYEGSVFDLIGFDEPIAPPSYAANRIRPIVDTQTRVMDIPLISDTDSDLGFYCAANGVTGWDGGALYVSRDGGSNYVNAIGLTARPFGRCLGILGTANYGYVDYSNTLMVQMNFGALFNSTNTAFFSESGSQLVAVGSNTNGWEIISYRYADPEATDSQYTINTLRRGLLGTEQQINTHKAGEHFIPLQAPFRVPANQTDLEQDRFFRGVSIGQPVDQPTPFVERYRGRDVTPYAPTALTESRANNDLILRWHRRDRKTSNLITWVSVPLSDLDRYRVRIYNGSAVVRSEMVNGTQYTYLESSQIADFGSIQDTVTYDVAQMSTYGILGAVAGSQ